jgi:NDP-sugar pyrophosphorylase family protein/aminoglycoside/choline kinase family phosphotransferase
MTDSPRKALVLAAGYGTRMLPLTNVVPKPLMPLWNRTLLDHNLDLLASWGVTDVLVNTHHLAKRVEQHVQNHPREDMRVSLSYEPEILGTGGAVANASSFLGDAPFWIVNADIAADVDDRPFLGYLGAYDAVGALWMHDRRGPRTVEMRVDKIVSFRSHPHHGSTYTFCGIQLVSPDIFRHIPRGEFSSIVEAYERAMQDGGNVRGVWHKQCYWADLGTPEQYLEAHREVKAAWEDSKPGARLFSAEAREREKEAPRHNTRVHRFAAIGPGVTFASRALVRSSVLWRGATLTEGCHIDCAIAGENVTLNGRIKGIAVHPGGLGFPDLVGALAELGWDTAATTALPLAPRGSNRRFARLRSTTEQAIAIHYSLERAENAFFVPNARFLKKQEIPVPEILLDRPDDCLTIVQDLGDRSLQQAAPRLPRPAVERLYRSVLDALVRIHANRAGDTAAAGLELSDPMSSGVLQWEREYFHENFAAPFRSIDAHQVDGAMRELTTVSRTLEEQPEVLIHRDLQSSNILLTDEDSRAWFIDFQGMRLGPAAYDIASLLCDPYVSLDLELQLSLLRYYDERAPHPVEPVFWTAAVQRLAQALGAYARLRRSRDTARFGRHLVPGIRMLLRALEFADNLSHLRALLCYAQTVEGDHA